jgi:hypothetical protein
MLNFLLKINLKNFIIILNLNHANAKARVTTTNFNL